VFAVTIKSSGGLSDTEIENMVKEGEVHAEEDKKKKENAELKNNADTIIYQTENQLREHKAKLQQPDIDRYARIDVTMYQSIPHCIYVCIAL